MLDFQPWIERKLGKWTFREMALAAAIVFLAITGFDVMRGLLANPAPLLPSATHPVAAKRWLNRDDSRGFMPSAALGNPGRDDGRYDIAWISGSPVSIRRAPPEWRLQGKAGYEMTDVAARYLVSLDGKPVRIQEYLQQGARAGDIRRAVIFAAHQPEIDAYVVEANPVWMLNDFLQFTLSRQRASILALGGATPFDYSVAARLLRPHEIGFEFLGTVIPAVRDRYDFFSTLPISKAFSFPLRKAESPVGDGQMVGTWMGWLFPDIAELPIPEAAERLRAYRNLMLMGDLEPGGLGMRTFAANVETLAAIGKPVVVFMPPLNPKLKLDPISVDHVRSMVAALDRQFALAGAPNITFRSDTVWAEPQPAAYLDILHLSHGQGVIDLVISLLEETIGRQFEKRPIAEVYGTSGSDASPANEETAQ